VSRAAEYLRSLTSYNVHGAINYYKLGQIAGYIEGLESAVEMARDGAHTIPPALRAKLTAALKEPEGL
jgi:hypothetical protein